MASAIVRSTYRYKRPPRKRKAVALEAPAVVTTKKSRRPVLGETAAEVPRAPISREEGAAAQPSTPIVTTKRSRRSTVWGKGKAAAEVLRAPVQEGTAQPSTPREAARVISPPHANDGRKPSIVTVKRKSRFGDAPDLTPEELQRRGEAADALWRELVRRATTKDRT
jgi:hypothetical protein